MPTYDYEHKTPTKKCSKGQTFEVFENITSKPKTRCPECKKAVRRCIGSGAGLIFKGTGFYCTDYNKPKAPEVAPETKPSEHKSADPAKATESKTYKKESK